MAQHIKFFFTPLIPTFEPWKVTLMEDWNLIMGDLHEHVTLINIQKNMLTLGVYDAAWLQELYILSPVLIKTINDYLKNEHVATLRFKNIGYKKAPYNTDPKFPRQQTQIKQPLPIPLTNKERSALISIQDSGLRTVLEQYLIRCKEK